MGDLVLHFTLLVGNVISKARALFLLLRPPDFHRSIPQFMTSDACRSKMVHHTGHGHVVRAALPNTEAHALHTWRMLRATKHAEDAGCERPTHPSVWVLASKSSGKHNDLGTKHREQWLFRLKQATFIIEENNFQ